jgi:Spy/CpxP family protein refolding chaperone
MAQHHIAHLTTLLSLTNEQVEQATTLFTSEATSEQSLRTTERSAHEALETAIKNDDTATIQSTAATLGQLNGQMTALHATTQAKFYATLTADQKTRYAELEHDHHRGPGGPSGPPPGM